MKTVSRSDLTVGSVVELRNKKRYLFIGDKFINLDMTGDSVNLHYYKDSLLNHDSTYDVMKLHKADPSKQAWALLEVCKSEHDGEPFEWTWERQEVRQYWYVGTNGLICTIMDGAVELVHMKVHTKLFDTPEGAQFERECKKVEIELTTLCDVSREVLRDKEVTKYCMSYCIPRNKVDTLATNETVLTPICFSSEKKCKEAIKTIGKERLIKYYFCAAK